MEIQMKGREMDYTPLIYASLAGANFGYGIYLLSPKPNLAGAMNIGVGVFVVLLAVLSRMPVV